MKQLTEIPEGDWRGFRRIARRYQLELKRIRDATAMPADSLRKFAAQAVAKQKIERSRKART